MTRRVVDVTLDNLAEAPAAVLETVFWELDEEPADPRFQKEEWFSSTMLEWGTCGKLLYEDETVIGLAQYAPPSLFPRLGSFRAARVSADAIYLAYCFVLEDRRGDGGGSELVRGVARDLVERGFKALEALGQREWAGGWLIPERFLEANRFHLIRPDPEVGLWRLDLLSAAAPRRAEAARAVPLPR